MWESLVIHSVLGIIALAVKNPQKKAELRRTLLEVRDAITALYPEDKSSGGTVDTH